MIRISRGGSPRNSAIISTVEDWGFLVFPLKERSRFAVELDVVLEVLNRPIHFGQALRNFGIFRRRSILPALPNVTVLAAVFAPIAQCLYCNDGVVGKSKNVTVRQRTRRKALSMQCMRGRPQYRLASIACRTLFGYAWSLGVK
jgi:hypothetical protein